MRPIVIEKESILEAAIHYAAQNSLENVSAKKIANSMGISDGSIFKNFSTMPELLTQCLYHIDRKIDAALQEVQLDPSDLQSSLWHIWSTYFRYLTAHGDYAIYYRQFRQSSYYDEKVVAGQDSSYSYFAAFVQKNVPKLGIDPDVFWVYVIGTTLNFAIRVASGQLPGTPADEAGYYALIFCGVRGFAEKRGVDLDALRLEL